MSLIKLKQEILLYKSLETIGGLMKSSRQTPKLQTLIQTLILLGFNEADITTETSLEDVKAKYSNVVSEVVDSALLELENNILTTEVIGSILYIPKEPTKYIVNRVIDNYTVLLREGEFQTGQIVKFNTGAKGIVIEEKTVRVSHATNELIYCSLVNWVIGHAPRWIKPEILTYDNTHDAELNVLVKVPNNVPPGTVEWELFYNNELIAKGKDYSVIGWCYIVKNDAHFPEGSYRLSLKRINGVTGEHTWDLITQTDKLICLPYLIDLT